MQSAVDQPTGDDQVGPGMPDLTTFPLAALLTPGEETVIGRAIRRRIDEMAGQPVALAAFDNFSPDSADP